MVCQLALFSLQPKEYKSFYRRETSQQYVQVCIEVRVISILITHLRVPPDSNPKDAFYNRRPASPGPAVSPAP